MSNFKREFFSVHNTEKSVFLVQNLHENEFYRLNCLNFFGYSNF